MADDRPDTPPHSFDAAYHGAEEPHTRDLNVPLIVTIGLISCVLLIVIGIGTVAWFRYEVRQEQWAKVVERENPELRQLNLEAEARLREIDTAMQRVAQRYGETPTEQRERVRSPVPVEELDEPEQFESAPEDAAAPDANNAGDQDDGPGQSEGESHEDDAEAS